MAWQDWLNWDINAILDSAGKFLLKGLIVPFKFINNLPTWVGILFSLLMIAFAIKVYFLIKKRRDEWQDCYLT